MNEVPQTFWSRIRRVPAFVWIGLLIAVAVLSAGGGYWFARRADGRSNPMQPMAQSDPAAGGNSDRRALYWYDPMVPNQHFDKPGKSPFMDMQLVPKYADERGAGGGVQINPNIVQNLGLRIAPVELGRFSQPIEAVGNIGFNQRNVAIVQSRTTGFVSRVYGRAPADVLRRGAPLVDLLVPEWAGAQAEFLALVRSGDRDLIEAARQRLLLLGMSADSDCSHRSQPPTAGDDHDRGPDRRRHRIPGRSRGYDRQCRRYAGQDQRPGDGVAGSGDSRSSKRRGRARTIR